MKGASAFLCLALALLSRCSAQKYCPEGWTSKTFSDGTGKCYLVSEDVVSFPRCQQEVCGSRNSTLTCIENGEENSFIGQLLRAASSK
eukprot:CAMPEP_0198210822 /NCGR_PEP_ID=MMETSP1445-20131203/22464_1 /TAXON_ID=36898 /ORGANISM="Pyramimonas sp., Strain CCMP2087" /LENGTH=87 /DNA_ID=CAMNT_0043884977 /DNA_START=76 /DNA_END=336 /DNA_ORIENTATION=+